MRITFVFVLLACLMACDSNKQPQVEKLEGAIPQAQLQALEKAKGVEQTLLEADEARRAKIDEASSPE